MSVEAELVGKVRGLLEKRFGGAGKESRARAFAAYDSNGDGFIDGDELKQVLEDAGVGNGFTRGMWVKGVMGRMDSNGDGLIDLSEFEAVIGGGSSDDEESE